MPILLILLLSYPFIASAQQPRPIKYFIAAEDQWCTNYITLGSDSTFFYSGSCESGTVAVAKGKWTKKRRRLKLVGFDSTSSYPKATITTKKGNTSNEVLITATDYFGAPFSHLVFGLIRHGDTSIQNPAYFQSDSLGKLIVSRKDFCGFYLIYQFHAPQFPLPDLIQTYTFENTDEINIQINFAASAGLDRGVILRNFGVISFTEKRNGLYFKKRRAYSIDLP